MVSQNSLLNLFNTTLGTSYVPSDRVADEVDRFLGFAPHSKACDEVAIRNALIADVNAKFRLNNEGIKAFLSECAKRKVYFNYHEKKAISKAFDSNNPKLIEKCLEGKSRLEPQERRELLVGFHPVSEVQTIATLASELERPTLTRKDSKPRDWSNEILEGLFCALVCRAFDPSVLYSFNAGKPYSPDFEQDYWRFLLDYAPELHSAKPSLVLLDASSFDTRRALLERVSKAYQELPKFGYLAVWIDPSRCNSLGNEWDLYTDVVLYAENHIERVPKNSFFRREAIETATQEYIPGIDIDAAQFNIWNDGFYYQDCFLIGESNTRLLVLMQKREADETPIPCPACRSLNVRGNSYPSLGVKSWECCNILCPDKSKFGRGKRYSFLQLLKQAAIEEPGNDIPLESVSNWRRDIQPERTTIEVIEMLARHYTLAGDSLLVDGYPADIKEVHGRKVVKTFKADAEGDVIPADKFFSSAFFSRFDIAPPWFDKKKALVADYRDEFLSAYRGEAGDVLQHFEENSVDGAVTSPPYYNAREYSQWENIYTYLYDMRRINAAVFRALKPGAYYLYNIFDYFDNERNVVFSAMGEKRLVLGAYTVDLFRRIGFEVVGNVAWDKGDIEGKRGFNGGNFSPYYQSPFNCWEHILVFRKPGVGCPELSFPTVLRQGAVIKMVRGENRHGHSAPYPEAIPALLTSRLPAGSVVLDPFAGSMTTAVSAARHRCRSICIEQNEDYFNLGVKRFRESLRQPELI